MNFTKIYYAAEPVKPEDIIDIQQPTKADLAFIRAVSLFPLRGDEMVYIGIDEIPLFRDRSTAQKYKNQLGINGKLTRIAIDITCEED